MEKETTFILVNTLPELFYEKIIGNAMRNFAKMVWLGELIEHGIKNKKIEGKSTPTPSIKKTTSLRKKEGDMLSSLTNNLRGKHLMPANPLIL